MSRILPCLFGLGCIACGPSLEENIDQLGGSGDERAQAQQMLLLAKDRSVDPMLEALADPKRAQVRLYLVDALVSLMTRIDSDKIQAALDRHLRQDPDSAVRARIAYKMGLLKQVDAIDPLLEAIDDQDGEVRYQALMALNSLEKKLDEGQNETLQTKLTQRQHDPHMEARFEALIHVERRVEAWVKDAEQAELKAQLDQADSLYAQALKFAPTSQRANYRLGRFYLDNGQEQKGMEVLRRHGMVLDIPRLQQAPQLDGGVEPTEWDQAAVTDSFYTLSFSHSVALPAQIKTRLHLGRTDAALYIGFVAFDDHPDSLVARITSMDPTAQKYDQPTGERIWRDDIFEFFIDGDFDHVDYGHFGINSLGVYTDQWVVGDRRADPRKVSKQLAWTANPEVAAHVASDRWSLEIMIPFNNKAFPHPQPGDTWGFNAVRVFRGKQYTQWVRTYNSGHSPNEFGLLVFE